MIRLRCASALAAVALVATASAAEAQYAYTKIMYPGSTWTEASGINDVGQVVGTYTDTAGIAHGFLYQNGVYTKMDYPGKAHNYAFGINDAGTIVGSFSEVMPRGPYHASLRVGSTWSEFDFPGNETDFQLTYFYAAVGSIQARVTTGTGLEFQGLRCFMERPNAGEGDVEVAHDQFGALLEHGLQFGPGIQGQCHFGA